MEKNSKRVRNHRNRKLKKKKHELFCPRCGTTNVDMVLSDGNGKKYTCLECKTVFVISNRYLKELNLLEAENIL